MGMSTKTLGLACCITRSSHDCECGTKGSSEEDKHNHIACGAKNIHTEALY